MEFEFDHSNPHPGKMGEIYEDQLYHVMSGKHPTCYQITLPQLQGKN